MIVGMTVEADGPAEISSRFPQALGKPVRVYHSHHRFDDEGFHVWMWPEKKTLAGVRPLSLKP